MEPTATVLITGAGGMVGGALAVRLRADGFTNVLAPSRDELDLIDRGAVLDYFARTRPEFVFMIAARVGGIGANMADPVGFLSANTHIALNLFEACHQYGVRRSLFLGSACIYPRDAAQPMNESALLSGPLEPTNEGYALSKILGIRLAQAYFRQFGTDTTCLMPCNLYGPGDHFDFARGHVIPAMVKRFVDAVNAGTRAVTLWGTGAVLREFMYVDDLIDAILYLFPRVTAPDICNVGTGNEVSIRELAELVAEEAQYDGVLSWDTSKPDGMPRRFLDISRQTQLGFIPRVSLREGIRRTVAAYRREAAVNQPV
jgi:GDP-L-fucose synthase